MKLRRSLRAFLGCLAILCGASIGVQAQKPFSVVMSMQNDPQTSMGFSWFTQGALAGEVRVWTTPNNVKSAQAQAYDVSLPYGDGYSYTYTVHKAVVTGLKPGTTYNFAVGSDYNGWSEQGSFTTAEENPESFSFIYVTDPQAQTSDQFAISSRTTHAAHGMFPNVNFWVNAGDLVDSYTEREREYEQFFSTQQDIFLQKPTAFVIGNHDVGYNRNFTHHFNYPPTSFDNKMKVSGSVYSFVWGDALFLAMQLEDYRRYGYLNALMNWIRNQVAQHPEVKWIIPIVHKPLYTGAGHAYDSDVKFVRRYLAPLFDELGVDFCIQGHDHVYQVIGPVYGHEVVWDGISNRTSNRYSSSGYSGGTYDVTKGTLYFSNNTAGHKKYGPRVKDEWFTGLFYQPNKEVFSHVEVTHKSIRVRSYAMGYNGAELYDEFTIVKPVRVQGVSLYPWSLSLTEGESEQLTATVTPTHADNTAVTWSSSDTRIATVDNYGQVTAISAGNATITATTLDGGYTAHCQVTVTARTVSVTGVTLDKSTLTLEEGGSDWLVATVHPEAATDKTVIWSSDNVGIAEVDPEGNVQAVSEGTAVITVTSTASSHVSASCTVTVTKASLPPSPITPIAVESVTLDKSTLTLEEGESARLLATVHPEAATDKTVIWSTSHDKIVKVDNKGTVTAVKAGEATITVTTANGKTATCKVTVKTKGASITKPTPVESGTLAQVQIVPNPFVHYVVLKGVEQVVEYTLYNVQGRVMLQGILTGEHEVQLDAHHVPAGIYMVVLRTHDGVATFRVVKQ